MNEQDKPLALELAEMLEYHGATCEQIEAAKELRRLHAENEELRKAKEHAEMIMQISCNHEAINELRRDAERYRWLIDQQWIQTEVDWRLIPTNQESTINQLGAAIDAAIKDK